MRFTPALLVLTLAASTASIAVPVIGLPGGPSAHAVEPTITEIALPATELIEAPLAGAAGLAARLVSPADLTPGFSLIGLTWDRPVSSAPDEPGFDLDIRTRSDGTWTDWTELEADDDGPDGDVDAAAHPAGIAAAQRMGTAPLWVGSSDAFQVRVDLLAGAAPSGLRALLVDPGRSAADAAVGSVPRVASQAHATIAWPTVHRRKDWGADEKLRNSSPRYTGAVKAAFVHHTAGTNDYAPADVPKILRGVYAYHVKGRGWSDIGYNFLVDRFGRIWEGRAGGIDRRVLGAHTGGFNAASFGVSVMGDYTEAAPSPETLAAVARVIAWKFALAGDGPTVDPLSVVELVSAGGGTSRYRSGTSVDFARISGHVDAGRTECPGKHLYAQLPTIRSLVRQILAEESTYGPVVPAETTQDAEPATGGPADTAPRDTARKTAPRDTAPRDTAPRDTAPRDTAPRDTAPRDTAPRDLAPEDEGGDQVTPS